MANQRTASKRAPQADRKPATVPSSRTGSNPILLLCFFCSGTTALIYEILWTRLITSVIGGAPFAVAIVLTIFMGGIGLGSHLGGRMADRRGPRSLVKFYGVLEIIIGVYALLVPVLIAALKPLYALLYNSLFDHFLVYNVMICLGCCLTLAIPVLCMGATLPILCRYQVRDLNRTATSTGLLYTLNTAGAALGALLGGLYLVPRLGVWGTLTLGAAINLLIGVLAFRLARKESETTSSAPTPTRVAEPASLEPSIRNVIRGALLIFGVSGFCSMAYEVIWTKLLSLIVGPTNYSFTIILAVFILGLALGSFIFSRLGDRTRQPEALLILTQLGAATLVLVVSQLLGQSQLLFAKLVFTFQDDFVVQNLAKAAVLFAFLVLPTLFLGGTFPLVSKICSRRLNGVGRDIGRAYAFNSLGAVLGSFVAGFVLVPMMGKEQGLRLVAVIQLLTALGVAVLLRRQLQVSPLWKIVGYATALAGLAGTLVLPRWNHVILASSKYHRLEGSGPVLHSTGWLSALLHGPRILAERDSQELLFYGDGIGGFTTVTRTRDALGPAEYHLANSGKFDASSRGDMNTQVLLAHLPMIFHPQPRSALVIGLASGITASEVLHYPVEKLDILEINEQVARASDFFSPWNHQVLKDPRTRLIIQDARAHLALSRQRYDVIISEPSNPWMAGCAALFTRDFLENARDHLNDGGCFALWLHTYQIDWDSVELIGRTFLEVFPGSALFSTHPTKVGSDYLLIGYKGSGGLRPETAQRNAAYAQKSANLTLPDARLLYRLLVSSDCAGVFGPGPLNTDNQPLLEYNAPRHLQLGRESADELIARLAKNAQVDLDTRIYLAGIADSVEAQIHFVEFALSLYEPFEGMFDPSRATPAQKAHVAELLEHYCRSNVIDLATVPDEFRERCARLQLEILLADPGTATNSRTLFYQADLQKALGQKEAALASYQRSAQLNPLDVRPLNQAGILLCETGRTAEGIAQFEKILQILPWQAEAHVNLAVTYYEAGNRLMAELHFKEALRIDPTYPEALNGLRVLQNRKRR